MNTAHRRQIRKFTRHLNWATVTSIEVTLDGYVIWDWKQTLYVALFLLSACGPLYSLYVGLGREVEATAGM